MTAWYSSSMNVTRERNLCWPGLYRGDIVRQGRPYDKSVVQRGRTAMPVTTRNVNTKIPALQPDTKQMTNTNEWGK